MMGSQKTRLAAKNMHRRIRRQQRLSSDFMGRNQMTANKTACTGASHGQRSESIWDRDEAGPRLSSDGFVAGGALDWPTDLFADTCPIVDDDELDDGPILVETPRVTRDDTPYGHGPLLVSCGANRETEISWRFLKYGHARAGITQ
jgi:hypothetical protein